MKQLPSRDVESVDCGSSLLDAPQVAAIEEAVKTAQVWKSQLTTPRLPHLVVVVVVAVVSCCFVWCCWLLLYTEQAEESETI